MTQDLVTIIMATYNRATFIEEALSSIKEQTYHNWQCIVVDDGSTDNTREILKEWARVDDRFKYFRRSDEHKKGLPGSRNMGLDLAKGKYVIFFDDDDIVHPQNLEINVNLLEIYNGEFCRYDKQPFFNFKPKSKFEPYDISKIMPIKIGAHHLEQIITGVLPFASCSVMWKLESIGDMRFEEDLSYAEEWEFYTRLLLTRNLTGISINEVLYYNRKHAASNTGEYYNEDPERKKAKAVAAKLIIGNLKEYKILSASLSHYFLRLAFFLKNYSLLDYTIQKSNYSTLKALKYRAGFLFYGIIRPYFVLKAKLKR